MKISFLASAVVLMALAGCATRGEVRVSSPLVTAGVSGDIALGHPVGGRPPPGAMGPRACGVRGTQPCGPQARQEPLNPELVRAATEKALGPPPNGASVIFAPPPPNAALVEVVPMGPGGRAGAGTARRFMSTTTNADLEAFMNAQ